MNTSFSFECWRCGRMGKRVMIQGNSECKNCAAPKCSKCGQCFCTYPGFQDWKESLGFKDICINDTKYIASLQEKLTLMLRLRMTELRLHLIENGPTEVDGHAGLLSFKESLVDQPSDDDPDDELPF